MPTPDKSQFAIDFLGPRLRLVGDEEDTRRHSFEAVRAGCVELRKTDPLWGLLIKTGGANVDGFAADIWLYNLQNGTAQVVDVVGNAEGAPNESGVRTAPVPSWGVKDLRSIDEWASPGDTVDPPGESGALAVPVPSLFAYEVLAGKLDALTARVAELEQSGEGQGTPARVALRTAHGTYVSAQPDGSVVADREAAESWETFDVEPQ